MGEGCKIISAPKKLNRKDYMESAAYPIIDQGTDYIVGYSDCADALLPDDEYVLFGDHTRNIKYFKGRFIQGADGLKIIKPNGYILPKFLYHIMKTLKIENGCISIVNTCSTYRTPRENCGNPRPLRDLG